MKLLLVILEGQLYLAGILAIFAAELAFLFWGLLSRRPITHAQRLGHADVRAQSIDDAELTQYARAVGTDLDAGAVLVERRTPLENVRGDAAPREGQRGRKAAYPCPDDEYGTGLALAGMGERRFGVLVGKWIELQHAHRIL